VAVAFLFLAWTYPYTSVLLGVLNAFTSATLAAMSKILTVVHVATPQAGNNAIFTVVHDGHPFNLSVISACSGVSSVVGFLLVGAAFASIIRGPLIRKILWLLGGMLLLWILNLGRLVLVFWAGQHYGEHFAIGVLHPYIGLVLFALGVTVMILCAGPLGLRIGMENRGPDPDGSQSPEDRQKSRRNLPVPKVFLAVSLVLVFAILVGVSNVGLQTYNLVADVSGSPTVISFIDGTRRRSPGPHRCSARTPSGTATSSIPASAVTCAPERTSSRTSSTPRISSPSQPSAWSSVTSSTAIHSRT
jgi:exosortase/archaeosortase family protein